MDSKDLYTLNLKLKRHKLKFDYDSNTDSIELSGVKADLKTPLLAASMILLGVALFIILIFFLNMRIRVGTGLLAGTPIGVGAIMFGNLYRRRQDNKNKKVITRDHIYLSNRKEQIEIPTDKIARIHFSVNKGGESQICNGHLYAQLKSGEEVKLLGLMGENVKYLDDDFTYLKRVISDFLSL